MGDATGPAAPGPPMLGDYDGSRRNNFTALRILFAWLVLYGHSFPITAKGISDPLKPFFGGSIWIGELAVSGFFAISGFLVAASFVRRGLLDYAVSRALRIYPALVVCVLLSVFLLGPVFTSLELRAYFVHPSTRDYLWNMTLAFPIEFRLPGVFQGHLRPGVNGSLWTLPVEMSCYVLLAIAGTAGLLRSRVLANAAMLALLLFASQYFAELPLIGRAERWARPALYSLLGVACYVNRDRLPLSAPLALFAALLAWAALGEEWFVFVFPPAFTYLVLFVAYRSPYLDLDGRLGDPSYGIYIYAWPVQQMLADSLPAQGPYFNMAVATVIVFSMALLSWYALERPALRLKGRLLKRHTVQPAAD